MSVCFVLMLLLGIFLRPQLESRFGDRQAVCRTQYEVTGAFISPD